MREAFACPECGCEIVVTGVSPGRQVRCGWCNSLVEVPFIPRGGTIGRARRSGRRRAWWSWRAWPAWARVAVAVLTVLVAVAIGFRVVASRRRSAGEAVLARLVASAANAEKAGRLGEALVDLEAALAHADRTTPAPPERDALRRRRDELAVREAGTQLEALARPASDPARAVGKALTLRARAARDPALVGLGPAIESALEKARTAWAEADAAEAARAFGEGRLEQAMELCERQYRTADDLGPGDRETIQDRATALARRMIERHGAIVEPVRGQFAVGTPESYAEQLGPAFREGLRAHGYLVPDPQTAWPKLWAEHAPFRIALEVVERQDDPYFQSPNRLTSIQGKLEVRRGPVSLWHDRPNARTQVPVPGLPALQASRLAVSAHRSPDLERFLYDNARSVLKDRLGLSLRNLPAGPAPEAPSTAEASNASP